MHLYVLTTWDFNAARNRYDLLVPRAFNGSWTDITGTPDAAVPPTPNLAVVYGVVDTPTYTTLTTAPNVDILAALTGVGGTLNTTVGGSAMRGRIGIESAPISEGGDDLLDAPFSTLERTTLTTRLTTRGVPAVQVAQLVVAGKARREILRDLILWLRARGKG